MIRTNGKYKIFNLEKGTDKKSNQYQRFSIGDSRLNPETQQWETTAWWGVTTYSNVELQTGDIVCIKEIHSVDSRKAKDSSRLYVSMYASVEKASTAKKQSDAMGEMAAAEKEAKKKADRASDADSDDDDLDLPF